MNEYNPHFAEKLIEAAEYISHNLEEVESQRTVLYLSFLSCEISLKFILENAGYEIIKIIKFSHKIKELLDEISINVEFKRQVTPQEKMWISAAAIRGTTVCYQEMKSTVGKILALEEKSVSKYPTEIRYGRNIYHYPPEILLDTAKGVLNWANENTGNLRVKQLNNQCGRNKCTR